MILSKFFRQVFINESQQNFQKTIAIVSGSFKFPTVAHWYMVEQYAKKADKVVVIISDPKNPKSIRKTVNGTVITPQMSKEIFDIYINRYNLQNKVTVIISSLPSPISSMFNYVDENLSDVNVIFGVSKKGGDETRFKSAEKYYQDNEHIHIINPFETAIEPYLDKNGNTISATDARMSLDNIDKLKEFLPSKLTENDIQKVLSILKVTSESIQETDNLKPYFENLDETEMIHLDITDDLLDNAKIMAYNVGMTATDQKGKDVPVNPKKFPNKAVDVIFPVQQLLVEVFLNTKTKKWDSKIDVNGQVLRLSPEQMGQFFTSKFYSKLMAKLQKSWPLSDKLYGNLFEGIANKEMEININSTISEDDKSTDSDDKDDRKYTASGRKIVHFSDMNVNTSEAIFYCWPNKDKIYNWSTWKDWKKIRPLCRIRFKHGDYTYGFSLSPVKDDYKNRGFKGYNLTLDPKLQWLTKEENEQVIKLSIVNKFIQHCIKQISEALEHSPEEIYKNINNPNKITIEEITLTQNIIRKTLNEIIKPRQIDSFKWA